MENCIYNQYEKKLPILNTKNIKVCGQITKSEAITKLQFVYISSISAEYLQKFDFFKFPKVV